MKKLKTLFLIPGMLMLLSSSIFAQDEKPYNPTANAREQLTNATEKAVLESKHVFVMIGGNW